MFTVEQIELRAAEIRAAEARAMRNLAAHLREAVIDLPIESRLALAFVKRARTFEMAATAHDVVLHGDGELRMLAGDVRDGFGDEFPTEVARRALLAAAEVENDDLASIMRRFASALRARSL
jgi:hypothetical protein